MRLSDTMMPEEEADELGAMLRHIFYLITTYCEDGAELALHGQGRDIAPARIHELSEQLHITGKNIAVLAAAAGMLCQIPGS